MEIIYRSLIVLFLIGGLHLIVKAQGNRMEEYLAIQEIADEGFKYKKDELKLSGQQLKNQIVRRAKTFRRAAIALNRWITKYFPHGEDSLSTGFVYANFVLALYMENSCSYEMAARRYTWVTYMLHDLDAMGLPEPVYRGVKIWTWVEKKRLEMMEINDMLKDAEVYTFNILQSKPSDVAKVIAALDALSKESNLKELISNNHDQIFALKLAARNLADSVAGENLQKWSAIYFRSMLNGFKLQYTKDSSRYYGLWVVGGSQSLNVRLLSQFDKIAEELQQRYVGPLDTLSFLSILVHGNETSLSAAEFQTLFHMDSFSETGIFELDTDRWNGRCIIVDAPVNVSNDSLICEIFVQAAAKWVYNDFDPISPPDWSFGLPLLFYDESEFGHSDTYHLYAMQAAIASNRFPAVEDFLGNVHAYSSHNGLSFANAYSRYFCMFLDANNILPELYRSIKNETSLRDSATLLAWLHSKVGDRTGVSLTESFKQFIQERDTTQIPTVSEQRKEDVIEYTLDFLKQF